MQNTRKIYVSGQLTLFACSSSNNSEWIYPGFLSSHSTWHRILDANAFLWLREAIGRAITSGRLSEQPEGRSEAERAAQDRLAWIAEVGIEHGSFTAQEIAEGKSPPAWFSFNMGLPRWAETCDLGFCDGHVGWWSETDDSRMAAPQPESKTG